MTASISLNMFVNGSELGGSGLASSSRTTPLTVSQTVNDQLLVDVIYSGSFVAASAADNTTIDLYNITDDDRGTVQFSQVNKIIFSVTGPDGETAVIGDSSTSPTSNRWQGSPAKFVSSGTYSGLSASVGDFFLMGGDAVSATSRAIYLEGSATDVTIEYIVAGVGTIT